MQPKDDLPAALRSGPARPESLRATLGDESCALDFRKGDKVQWGTLDRFGLFSLHNDGGHGQARIYFDDLKYSAASDY